MITHGIHEIARRPAPGGRPQPIAFHEGTLWIGAWDTAELYAVEPGTWNVRATYGLPGKPFGIAPFGGELRLVISEGDDDDRFFYRFAFGSGIVAGSRTACPEVTGSHLAADGDTLYLAQMTLGRILAMDGEGTILRTIALPTRCAGIALGPAGFSMIVADDEFDNLSFATLELRTETATTTILASMPPESRSLTYDGRAWWTNLRELGQTLSFTLAE